jgi:hypothetical protein
MNGGGAGGANGAGAAPSQHSRGRRPQFSETAGVDQLLSMVLVLASELSVLRDRVDSIERVAAAKGIDLAGEIERLAFDQAALDARETRRQELLQRLYYLMRKEAHELENADTAERYVTTIDEIAKP